MLITELLGSVMLRFLYAIAVSTVVLASTTAETFAQAERSPWCADFGHQDKAVHKKSLVIQIKPDNQDLRKAFAFNDVLTHLIANLGGDQSSQKPESLVLSMTESFKSTRERQPDSGLKMNFDPRAATSARFFLSGFSTALILRTWPKAVAERRASYLPGSRIHPFRLPGDSC
jgi:hypothetical protein